MSCNTYLQGGLIKSKVKVGLLQISQKERLSISYDIQVLLGVISQCVLFSCILQKRLPLLFTLAKKRTYLDTQLKGSLFPELLGSSLSHSKSRNRMINTL